MNGRIAAAMAGASLALGIVVGAAGAIVARDVTSPTMNTLSAEMGAMHQAMASHAGTDRAPHTMELMGAGHMDLGSTGPDSGGPVHAPL